MASVIKVRRRNPGLFPAAAQTFVSPLYLFKALCGFGSAWVAIGMKFHRQGPIGLLHFSLRRILRNPENLVGIMAEAAHWVAFLELYVNVKLAHVFCEALFV